MVDLMDRLIDPLRYPEFLPGLAAGLLALTAGALAALVGRRPAPVAGALIVGAFLAGLLLRDLVTTGLVAGLALLLVAAGLWRPPDARGTRPADAAVGLVPAFRAGLALVAAVVGLGLLTAQVGPATSAWRVAVTAGGAAVTAGLVAFDRRSVHAGLAPVLVLLTAGGVYATVPDTEQARVLLAVALPLAALGWPWRLARLGPTGALLVGGALTWVAATGGYGRAGSIVGALGAAGLLLACPAARAVAGRTLLDRVPPTAAGGAAVAAVQLVLALTASRVAGLRDGAVEAAFVAAPVLAVAAAVLAATSRRGVTPPTG